jgi:signal transduction histidine kinase/ActR/RegA family two-component response regulator
VTQRKDPSAALRPPERVNALRRAGLLDRGPEPVFDRLTRLTCRLFGAPLALVTLLDGDRLFLKSQHGLTEPSPAAGNPPISLVFTESVLMSHGGTVVEDTRASSQSADDPGIRRLGVGAFAGVPLLTPDGAVVGSLCVIEHGPRQWTPDDLDSLRDIAAHAMGEINLRLAAVEGTERVEAIGRLAGGIAHDFNNLLTTISGLTGLLLEETELSPRSRDDLGKIQRATERATSLTRQLLALRHRQVVNPRIIELNALVSEALSIVRSTLEASIQVGSTLDPDLDPVLADPGQLERIVVQLSCSVRPSIPDGGRLEIVTRRVEIESQEGDRSSEMRPGRYAALTLRASDPSGSREVGDSASGRRSTTRPPTEWANLGLASVYGIVRQSGGYLAVDGDPTRGTGFTVYLPAHEGSGPYAAPPEVSDDLSRSTETILLVEDEEQVRELACRVLERSGYTVLAAPDAETATAIADRHPGHIHLLLTDMVLPNVSGRELAARLGIHRPAVKVLYISGTSEGSIARHRLLQPGTEFLEKPFSLDGLLRKVRQVLRTADGVCQR